PRPPYGPLNQAAHRAPRPIHAPPLPEGTAPPAKNRGSRLHGRDRRQLVGGSALLSVDVPLVIIAASGESPPLSRLGRVIATAELRERRRHVRLYIIDKHIRVADESGEFLAR